ncbi:MAG: hypothetical protein HYZ53_28560 [Planctomycetes bacterium]|nr:hypothetical protein [Planctomycetota bacterium]
MSSSSLPEGKGFRRKYIEEAFEILGYNQDLVQFADTKAGTLIVINSLFVASSQVAHSQAWIVNALQTAAVALAAVAIACCFWVVRSRNPPFRGKDHHDLVFFAEVLTRPDHERYMAEFLSIPDQVHLEDVLRRVYIVSWIASRKFRGYALAERVTILAGAVWVASNLLALVLR